jgi:hypothetical protein
MMKLYLLMVQKSLILLYVWTKFCSMKRSHKIRDVAEAEKEWQPNQRFIEQGKKFKTTTNLLGL